MVMVSIQLQCDSDSDSGVCGGPAWQMAQLGAGGQRMQKGQPGDTQKGVAGTVQALLDLGGCWEFPS